MYRIYKTSREGAVLFTPDLVIKKDNTSFPRERNIAVIRIMPG